MNPLDDQLARLFRAAQTRDVETFAVPFGLETRALAAWRGGQIDEGGLRTGVLVRGFLIACAIMVASFWPVLNSASTTSNTFADTLQLADSTVSSADAP